MEKIKQFLYWITRAYFALLLLYALYIFIDPQLEFLHTLGKNSGLMLDTLLLTPLHFFMMSIFWLLPIAIISLVFVRKPNGRSAVQDIPVNTTQLSLRTRALRWITAIVALLIPTPSVFIWLLCLGSRPGDGCGVAASFGLAVILPFLLFFVVLSLFLLLVSEFFDRRN